MKGLAVVGLGLLLGAAASAPLRAPAQATPAEDDAAKFGAQETAISVSLSADGKRLAFVGPSALSSTIAVVVDTTSNAMARIASGDGKPFDLQDCDWSAADRLVCVLGGITEFKPAGRESVRVPVSRLAAVDADGRNPLPLGQRDTAQQMGVRQSDGAIVDWLDGKGGDVLMARTHLPESSAAGRTARTERGLGVDRVNTRTGAATVVEHAEDNVSQYLSDGLGTIRIRTTQDRAPDGYARGVARHFYRKSGSREWLPLGINRVDSTTETMVPIAVDPIVNAVYVGESLNGRQALYRIALDGSMKKELVFASKEVDVSSVVRVGRAGRVIGAVHVTDRRQVEYFDPAYQQIAADLARALPKLPLIYFVGGSADERILLVRASSDVDPGHYYLFDRDRKSLVDILKARPALRGKTLSAVNAITYAAADGTSIPGYLTLPPGVTDAKNLPAIVMPHGGPGSRDAWGFDWLAQFWAQQGYAVLQPNFRGSAGYGDAWFVDNGFRSWKVAIGDVCDGGRWLVAQGIADPARLAVFGWSYGGYAALQANVLDANLFKAVVAVAPVTDLALLKETGEKYTSSLLLDKFVGSGPHVKEGSPAQQAQAFKAPVLMFHGDNDLNVDIEQSRRMDKALRAAGKSTELIVYPGLEHGLRDGTVRADMLRRSQAFLSQHLKP